MAGNASPVFGRRGQASKAQDTTFPATLTSAAVGYDGTAAENTLVFTAEAMNGSWVSSIRFKAIGTNTASVARIYLNNASTNGTASNNLFIGECSLPGTTAILTAATAEIEYPINRAINAGFRIYVGLGTAVAAGWVPSVVAEDY